MLILVFWGDIFACGDNDRVNCCAVDDGDSGGGGDWSCNCELKVIKYCCEKALFPLLLLLFPRISVFCGTKKLSESKSCCIGVVAWNPSSLN